MGDTHSWTVDPSITKEMVAKVGLGNYMPQMQGFGRAVQAYQEYNHLDLTLQQMVDKYKTELYDRSAPQPPRINTPEVFINNFNGIKVTHWDSDRNGVFAKTVKSYEVGRDDFHCNNKYEAGVMLYEVVYNCKGIEITHIHFTDHVVFVME